MLLPVCTTQVKKGSKKEKEKKNNVTKNLLPTNAFTHWTTSVSTDSSNLKEVYIPSLW